MKKIVLGLVACWAAWIGWADEPPTYGTISMAVPTFVWVRTTNDLTITIPVRFSQATTERRTVRWQATDGTAKLGTDFTQSNGERVTAGSTETTTEFEIYLKPNTGDRSIKSFTVTLTGGDGVTVDESAATTTIYLLDGGDLAYAESTSGTAVATARLENRDWSTLAASLVNGFAVKSADGESAADVWDTTAERNGWQTLSDGETNRNVVVQNDAQYEIVGGRLAGNTVWESNKVYVVRNWVYVPSGCTLTIMTNTVVKFCEQTGISGSVVVKGAEDEPVVWTSAKDDTIGGDTDCRADTPTWGDYNVASVSDTGLAIRYATLSGWGTASVTPLVVGAASAGVVRVPVTISASRSTPFFVNWRLSDGSQSGQVRWENSGEGTKFVELDAAKMAGGLSAPVGESADGTVSIELYESQGINVSTSARVGEVAVYRDAALQTFDCTNANSVASARLENRDWSTLAASLVNGVTVKAADGESAAVEWDTTAEKNGWQVLSDGETNRNVVVQNDEKYEIVGGRLAGDTVWEPNKVYVVRNWVYVPSGCTLTIMTNTVVKFCEQTGISGSVVVKGAEDEPVVWTSAKDDTVGGDTDCRADMPTWGDYNVASVSDTGLAIRYATLSGWGTASVTPLVVGAASAGVVRVPVTISASRSTPFFVNWRLSDGSQSGQVRWENSGEGTQFVELDAAKMAAGNVGEGGRDGYPPAKQPEGIARWGARPSLELYESQGINVSTSARVGEVAVYRDAALQKFEDTTAEAVATARLENRDWSTLAASLVNGVAVKATNGESAAVEWDTTSERDGWQTLSDGETNRNVVVQNDEQYEIVGGRLAGDTVWESNKVYVVRNWVYVPSGCTLTIMTNTVVKFCEQTGISGSVVVKGAEDEPVVWTSAKDDTIGGDTDLGTDTPAWGDYNVASVSDTGLAIRYATLSGWGTASVTPLVVGAASAGVVRVPVTISVSRSTPFFVNWRLSDGSASGQVRWANSGEGTKFVELDAVGLSAPRGEDASGTVSIELYESQGINVSTSARTGEVAVYRDAALQTFEDTAAEAVATARLENRDLDTVGAALVKGVVAKSDNGDAPASAWDTTKIADGWVSFADGDESRKVLVRNDTRYVVVGGRLAGDTVWSADKVYIVRNWVYVPSGCTLTIGAKTVVKFCEQTGISGNVVVAASASEPAVLTAVADDAVGGNADCRVVTPVEGTFSLSGSFSHVGCLLKYATASGFPVVSVPSLVAGSKGSGVVRVPVSVSGSRTGEFAVNWTATDLGAKYGEDYAKRSGRIVWSSTSEGTKFVEIPLNAKGATEPDERFVFTLTDGTDLTVSKTENAATVDLYDSDRMNDGQYLGLVISDASPYASFKTPVFGTDEDGGAYRQELQNWLVGKGKMAQPSVGADDATVAAAVRSAGEAKSVKGVPLWEEFVAGTNPDDERSKFTASISFDEEGKPVVTWSPALNDESPLEGGSTRQGVRRYRVFGKNELTAVEKWTECPEGSEGDYRFFKVSVDMQ